MNVIIGGGKYGCYAIEHLRQKHESFVVVDIDPNCLAAKRFKEGLEKLRAEAKERYIQEQEKLEQRESDDRTTIAFARDEGVRS